MDDCNGKVIVEMDYMYLGSDSSMDDCNLIFTFTEKGASMVQIPLWTIVTQYRHTSIHLVRSSDSSMDDCNGYTVNGVCVR